ncbi:retrotransposon protein [Cucumis melo var. makuwa]|uniref:Retrotransposon protein n=1 Tax=Cucumis melo var. makuwa TaxID=1194695 RepID=A0A5D3C913_CUCMM|nr:retrotransposon protein [Cucumis melo var. makuwa]
MTYCYDVDGVDEGDSTYATTTASEDIHYIETTNKWSQWRDELTESMFTDWQLHNGTFCPGYLAQLVCMMTEKLPGCQSHPAAKGLLNRPFPYYDELTYVFGRDRSTDRFAETFADVESNEPGGYDKFDMGDGNEEFPPVTGSSGSKRKRGSQRDLDVEAIHLALDQTNEQLRMIAEWPACTLAMQMTTMCARNSSTYCVRCQNLRVWIGRYCKGIFCLVWTTFGVSYSCLRMRGRDFVESSYETSRNS